MEQRGGDDLVGLVGVFGFDLDRDEGFGGFLDVPEVHFEVVGAQDVFLVVGVADGVDVRGV
jgi:hypothetical protein